MADTSIEWTDKVWNVVRGCAIVSEGCRNCYAMKQAHRFSGKGGAYDGLTKLGTKGPVWTGVARFIPEMLEVPLKWSKPSRIFVNSMSDLFHEDVNNHDIAEIFAVMALAPRHTFQVLTKRPARMREIVNDPIFYEAVLCSVKEREESFSGPTAVYTGYLRDKEGEMEWPLRNVHLGVSVEDQSAADERIPELLSTEAAVRFLSVEPLLGPVDLRKTFAVYCYCGEHYYPPCAQGRCPNAPRVHWVIVGGESGPGSRPMHPSWVRSLRDECKSAGVPFFFKQWGAWGAASEIDIFDPVMGTNVKSRRYHALPEGGGMLRIGKKKSGRELDGRTWDEMPVRRR